MLEDILKGVRVLDLTQNVAGPFCSQVLGDLGATVIKVERPGLGDDSRSWRAPEPGSVPPHFVALNRNKQSICVDLGAEAGRELVARLVAGCDVFIHSMKPGSAEARGLGYEDLKANHAGLIYCAVSAYGEDGPLKNLPGYDPVMQAFSGLMSICGHADDDFSRVPVSIIDVATGLWAAVGILGASLQRARTGEGGRVQVSLLETSLSWMNALITAHAIDGRTPGRMGSALASSAPYELFACADGQMMLAAPNNRLFSSACHALGLGLLLEDARFTSNALRLQHRQELHRLMEERTRELTVASTMGLLRAAGVPCGELNTLPEALKQPQVQAVGMVGAWAEEGASVPLIEMPLRINGARSLARAYPPGLGQHTLEVLRAAGLAEGDIQALCSSGVVS